MNVAAELVPQGPPPVMPIQMDPSPMYTEIWIFMVILELIILVITGMLIGAFVGSLQRRFCGVYLNQQGTNQVITQTENEDVEVDSSEFISLPASLRFQCQQRQLGASSPIAGEFALPSEWTMHLSSDHNE